MTLSSSAGASAAITAARAGLRVALVDKNRFPRDKLCGGGLTGRAFDTFQRVFQVPAPDVPTTVRRDMVFRAFGEDLGENTDAPPLHFIMRRDFDAELVRLALSAGAEDFTGRTGTLDLSEHFGVALALRDQTLFAPAAIAADGVNSPTARHLFGKAFDHRSIGFALEVECEDLHDRSLRIDFGAAEWGYGWQFPKTCGTTIGVGGVLSRNKDMKATLHRYLAELGVTQAPRPKGQFLPFGAFLRDPGHGRVLFAGDAAGLVDPITGEGIGHALDSGAKAAQAVVAALEKGAPDAALPAYRLALWPIQSGLRHANLLRNLMFRKSLRPAFIRSFRSSKTLRYEYLGLMAGQTEYGPLMRKTAARVPGFLWRSMTGN